MGFFLTGMGLAQNNSCECDPSALGNLASKVVSLENSVVQLQNDTEGQRGSISTLSTEVANLKSTTEQQVELINSEIGTIGNEVSNLKSTTGQQVNTINSEISALDGKIANLKTNTQQQVDTINSEITTLKSTDVGIQSDVNNLKQTSVKARVVG